MSFYDTFFAQPMIERQRIADASGLSLAYILKHTYVQGRAPKFHFHNALGLDRASNGKLSFLDTTEGAIDWPYVLQRLKSEQKAGRIARTKTQPHVTAQFEAFWSAYPRKLNRIGALRSWCNQRADEHLTAILKDIATRLPDWQREAGKFIPHPTTYLNQRRWEEAIELGETSEVFAGAL